MVDKKRIEVTVEWTNYSRTLVPIDSVVATTAPATFCHISPFCRGQYAHAREECRSPCDDPRSSCHHRFGNLSIANTRRSRDVSTRVTIPCTARSRRKHYEPPLNEYQDCLVHTILRQRAVTVWSPVDLLFALHVPNISILTVLYDFYLLPS
jgi:hypothetical protein